jgi:tetratricopeptide (TPR) repeat protein
MRPTAQALAAFGLAIGLSAARGRAAAPEPPPPPDTVVLQHETGGRIVQRCTILDYGAKAITFQLEAGRPATTYPADRVIEVKTPLTPSHEKGRALLAAGKWSDAAEAFQRALFEEGSEPSRGWVRREILAQLVRCALAAGDRPAARAKFDLLLAGDDNPRHFHLIPLVWTSAAPEPAETIEARTLLESTRDAARLMGAAALLFDPRYGSLARSELRSLLSSGDPRVAALARAQAWRITRAEREIRREELDEWQARIDAMPADLRAGPYYVLGGACAARGDFDRAARFLLWAPLVDAADAHLAARAALEAAEALARIGRREQADRVARDVLRHYPQTPFAQDAQALIESHAAEGTTP